MRDDTCVIIQGPTDYIDVVLTHTTYPNYLISTWNPSLPSLANKKCIYNDHPSIPGPMHFNYQKMSTLYGLREAKRLGFKYAVKIRSDMYFTNPGKFFEIINYDKLNFIAWHYHEVYPKCPGYLIDYMMAGPIDDMISLWDIDNINMCSVPEVMMTDRFIKLKKECHFLLDDMNSNNDIYWVKRNLYISTYKVNNIYDKYRKYDFGINYDNLSNSYLDFLK